MVKGLDRFCEHFEEYSERYILIGGTACELIMREAGLEFRATKDLDLVLCVESIDPEFVSAFWAFIKAGQYRIQESAEGKPRFYRFQKPAIDDFPSMLELFSPAPEALLPVEGSHLTPIPVDAEISSLSAILLDSEYYRWMQSGKKELDHLSVLGAEHLISLKARAWLDLHGRKEGGEPVDRRSIKKHRNDILRLFRVIGGQKRLHLSTQIHRDMSSFLDSLSSEKVDLKSLGLGSITLGDLIEQLRWHYKMDGKE